MNNFVLDVKFPLLISDIRAKSIDTYIYGLLRHIAYVITERSI